MIVTLLYPREYQDAGALRTLMPGEYDLPEIVACALMASGVAVRVMAAPERAVVGPRETKPRRKGAR